ncbi:MAG TPA: phosphodiester glycosidase family protein, partial [Acidimicrobiales bacterium]|nr:phosphodiester glycosidase family protein [Acidimicrobiales bacterium]
GYSVGMSLPEAADLMAALGATDALNLDGGGSTTFVLGGEVANQPSDRLVRQADAPRIVHQPGPRADVVGSVERPVADALAIVPRQPAEPLHDPLGGASPALPLGPGIIAAGPDAGSNPTLGVPALVGPPDLTPPADPPMVALATVLNLAVGSGLLRHRTAVVAAAGPTRRRRRVRRP